VKLCAAVAVFVTQLDDVSATGGSAAQQELMFPMAEFGGRSNTRPATGLVLMEKSVSWLEGNLAVFNL
jgi:hypothetical protein